jgi:hypothetical protein
MATMIAIGARRKEAPALPAGAPSTRQGVYAAAPSGRRVSFFLELAPVKQRRDLTLSGKVFSTAVSRSISHLGRGLIDAQPQPY